MAKVQRANVYLTVPDADVKKYLAKGFNEIDPNTGKVITQSVPTELSALKRAFSEHTALLEQKDAEIQSLKLELQRVKKSSKTVETSNVSTEAEEFSEWKEQPSTTAKKSKAKK